MENPTIHITGNGIASHAPDTSVMNIEISAIDKIYAAAMKKGAIQVDELKKSLSDFGFNPDELKTVSFNIRPIYEYEKKYDYSGYNSTEKSIFSHFDCVQILNFEFPFDNETLGKAVDSMINCPATPKISLDFKIKDKSKLFQEVLESATKDARRKAEVLCNASGVKLGKLLMIDCSWDELEIRNSFRCDNILMGEAPSRSSHFNFNMNDVDVQETVNFIWEIIT